MADENNEDDSWLYGSSNNENQSEDPNNDTEEPNDENEGKVDDQNADLNNENEQGDEGDGDGDGEGDGDGDDYGEHIDGPINESADNENADGEVQNGKVNGQSDDDDDSDDDDVVVTIGDIKSGSSYNIKQRGTLLAPATAAGEKPKTAMGKFSMEEFESVGTISGQSAIEFNIEAIEEKPWRKPGADITDYFNYGFNEDTWRAYCERQKKMRSHESGAGWISANTNAPPIQQSNNSGANRILTSLTTTENSKYTPSGTTNSNAGPSNYQNNRSGLGPPAGRNLAGQFNNLGNTPAKENVIQVMTAERREYSRPKGKFDVSMTMPPPPFNVVNEPFYPEDNFSYGYEPTQEQQWNNDNVGWVPSGIKELTPGPQMVPPPHINMNMPPPNAMMPPNMMNVPQMVPPPQQHMPPMGMPPQMPMMPPPGHMLNARESNEYRPSEQDDKRNAWRARDKEREYRERSRERGGGGGGGGGGDRSGDRGKSEEVDRQSSSRTRDEDSPSRDRDRRRDRDRYRDRGSTRRSDRSRSRERSERRRRSKSRESSRKSRDKKKSHKKDKDDSE